MTVFPLVAVGLLKSVVAVLFVLCAVVLILIILVQKGKGGGLSGALGGGMASGILGSKTGDFLTWLTVGVAVVFLLLAVIMAKFYKPSVRDIGTTGLPAPAGQTRPVAQPPVLPAATADAMPVDIEEAAEADK